MMQDPSRTQGRHTRERHPTRRVGADLRALPRRGGRGIGGSFRDHASSQASELVEWTHLDHDPESLLGYLLDWVVYHHRVFARIPVATHIEHSNEWNIRVETAALNGTPLPESVYVRDVSVRPERGGWYCHATLDVGKETAELACTPAPESTPRIQRVISEATPRFD